jgi:hypothetical protein
MKKAVELMVKKARKNGLGVDYSPVFLYIEFGPVFVWKIRVPYFKSIHD